MRLQRRPSFNPPPRSGTHQEPTMDKPNPFAKKAGAKPAPGKKPGGKPMPPWLKDKKPAMKSGGKVKC